MRKSFSLAAIALAAPCYFVPTVSATSVYEDLIAQGRAVNLEARAAVEERMSPNQAFPAQGRITVESGNAIPITDQSNASTIYYTPYQGSRVSLYDGSKWISDNFTQQSLALSGLTANTNYDVFLYDSSNTPTIELTAWSSNTARATALTTLDGVYVKSGATTRRYVGTIRTTSTTQTQDTAAQRFVWNYYNRTWRHLQKLEATATWTYATTAYRAANNTATNLVEYVAGTVESILPMLTLSAMSGGSAFNNVGGSFNFDATTSSNANVMRGGAVDTIMRRPNASAGFEYGTEGYHAVQWVEAGNATGTTTYAGAPNAKMQGGMLGMILN